MWLRRWVAWRRRGPAAQQRRRVTPSFHHTVAISTHTLESVVRICGQLRDGFYTHPIINLSIRTRPTHVSSHLSAAHLVARAEGLLHVMQAVRHGVDGIYHKPHLSVLGVLLAKRLTLCRGVCVGVCVCVCVLGREEREAWD